MLSVLTVALGGLVVRIHFQEDITAFLPVDDDYRQSMKVYQEVAAADKVIIRFDGPDEELIIDAVTRYGELLSRLDTARLVSEWAPQFDYSQALDVFSFLYEQMPYYLEEADYQRIDSLLSADARGFFASRFTSIQHQLGGTAGSWLQPMFEYDPLGLGSRLGQMMQTFQPQIDYSHRDGYLFMPDGGCLVMVRTPFGGSETSGNARLVDVLTQVGDSLMAGEGMDQMRVHLFGAPVIAVGNARQIKVDTIKAIAVSLVLIILLLIVARFRMRMLLQIAASTLFGFLFALGLLHFFTDEVSLIVVGITSIIIGIAVNYPLHYVCHRQDLAREGVPSSELSRRTLRDLVQPLLIGNITTVGAFLTLVPLRAVALRDLGLFSALMLVGTIVFVLIFLPHLGRGERLTVTDAASDARSDAASGADGQGSAAPVASGGWLRRVIESPWSLAAVVAITLLLGYFSIDTAFDTNLNHINYMTPEQRADMAGFEQQMQGGSGGTRVVYVASVAQSADLDRASQALESLLPEVQSLQHEGKVLRAGMPSDLLPSRAMQMERLVRWERWRSTFVAHHLEAFRRVAAESGFTPEAFSPFEATLTRQYPLLTESDFAPLIGSVLSAHVGAQSLVAQLVVPADEVDEVESRLRSAGRGSEDVTLRVFDLTSLNSRVTRALTEDFNYIGIACAAIVFLFLWLSFGRLELALVAFMPMAVGSVWILGIMQLLGIQFNIVNVILATFIFGQGDDYTIFITEGLVRDYREGGRMLVHYQRSILFSALIMLAGIGSLILAEHPAMHSLAEVTIIGMGVVLLMAWLLPPMLFHWLVRYDGSLRAWLARR